MIARRVSSVVNMTKLLVLDDGKCIGYGCHEELMARKGFCYALYASQFE